MRKFLCFFSFENERILWVSPTKLKACFSAVAVSLCLTLFCFPAKGSALLHNCTATYLPRNVSFSVANTFYSNMVLQREKPIILWGTASKGDKISVKTTWLKKQFFADADSTNTWKVELPASKAIKVPQIISLTNLSDNKVIKITNVLIGDVWLCAGQSNMAMPLMSQPPSFEGVVNYEKEIAGADDSLLRFTTVDICTSLTERDTLLKTAKWQSCTPSTTPFMSAVAYYFGKKLRSTLHVPVGLVVCAVNGSICESWISLKDYDNSRPMLNRYTSYKSIYYNAMVKPWAVSHIKGVIWYQGESNHNYPPDQFFELTKTLITNWRTLFRDGDLPFYFAQLAPFDESQTNNTMLSDYAKIREAQAALLTVPNTGMAVTMDVGDAHNHHPRNKKPVGDRLAFIALHQTYHRNGINFRGPQFKSFNVEDSTIVINFKSGTAGHLQTTNNEPLKQFFLVEGADCRLIPAQAKITGNKIVLAIPKKMIMPIQSVRYAFTNFPVTNIQNKQGLPMEPFRSDRFWDQ